MSDEGSDRVVDKVADMLVDKVADEGVEDEVKQARRAKRVAEGHQLEIGAQRAPRFLVVVIISILESTRRDVTTGFVLAICGRRNFPIEIPRSTAIRVLS